jgi:hypothetical protein
MESELLGSLKWLTSACEGAKSDPYQESVVRKIKNTYINTRQCRFQIGVERLDVHVISFSIDCRCDEATDVEPNLDKL